MARRLITIAVSDFLCWFPVGLLGLLSFNGIFISDETNVAVVIFILPINAGLNPFLYTLNTQIEKRRKSKENKLMEKLKKSQTGLQVAGDNNRVLPYESLVNREQAVNYIRAWKQQSLIDCHSLVGENDMVIE